jgi:hypothetical protein
VTMAMPSGVLGPLRMYITSIGSFCILGITTRAAVGVVGSVPSKRRESLSTVKTSTKMPASGTSARES